MEPIEVKDPAAPIVAAGKGMPLLGPIFNVEADLQALALNLGSYDEEAIKAELKSLGVVPPAGEKAELVAALLNARADSKPMFDTSQFGNKGTQW